ncbi:hypothetical protein BaRGS_00037788 [Batillaria attramentaria]|uniref:Secreted protein n=1 Tax=Batillaria attramentaria TaxID=370345 RepID=A0ABD0J802_9CAEN
MHTFGKVLRLYLSDSLAIECLNSALYNVLLVLLGNVSVAASGLVERREGTVSAGNTHTAFPCSLLRMTLVWTGGDVGNADKIRKY